MMKDNIAIVAIPRKDDPVWEVSSETVPHMTILYIKNENLKQILEFVEHAASQLPRFSLDVDRRGTLGPDQADVLFFAAVYNLPAVKQFRHALLQNGAIQAAYQAIEQYPVWTPHLTLGYPESPAKELKDRHALTWMNFDRIAVWYEEYAGAEFELKNEYAEDGEVGMSDEVGTFLAHYGVKGMKWGKRRSREELSAATSSSSKGKAVVKTTGGAGKPAHNDAVQARLAEQKLKKSGINSLSNQELQNLQNRLNLERNVNNLTAANAGPGREFVKNLLVNVGKQQVTRAANQAAAQQVDGALRKKK